jgi:glycosyltransferase involved in cell wall biosynthesis
MSTTPKCSIIIRAYNEEDHIGRLLTGISEQSLDDIEIIVVDSGSTDATVPIASRFPTRILTIPPHDFTFGRSLNMGCSAARGEFLVFASAHVYPRYPDWLEKLIEPFKDPAIGMVYGMQRGDGTTRYSEHQQFKRMFPEASIIPQGNPLCNNANAAIRRSLWEQHPFDESLSGLEDLDWATWLLAQDRFLAYHAEAVVVHVHNESPRQVFRRYEREAIALCHIRPEEKFGLGSLITLYVSNIISDSRQAVRERCFMREFWGILWFRWMQFLGTYVGFRHSGPVTDAVIQAFYYPNRRVGSGGSGDRAVEPIDYTSVIHSSDGIEADESRG